MSCGCTIDLGDTSDWGDMSAPLPMGRVGRGGHWEETKSKSYATVRRLLRLPDDVGVGREGTRSMAVS